MFGFITINAVDLSEEERTRYKAAYCGLCHMLKERSGTMSRLCLSYDLTFLVLLLNSLYEPLEKSLTIPCPTNPLKQREALISQHTAYAADMALVLTYHKCLDDWNDERKITAHQMVRLLDKPYHHAAKRWPKQCHAIEDGLTYINELECSAYNPRPRTASSQRSAQIPDNDSHESFDEAARSFGTVLGAVFAFDEGDQWVSSLWRLGAKLGRFIYFMDAAVDLDDDIRRNNYNPLRYLALDVEHQHILLMHLIGEAVDEFERLPLERDLHLMRSVLYAGVWQQFYAKYPDINSQVKDNNRVTTTYDKGQQ